MPEASVVISRAPSGSARRATDRSPEEQRTAEDEISASLAAQGLNVLVVPHIYNLPGVEGIASRLASLAGPLTLASWLHPRPAEWVLRYLGYEGEVACVDIGAYCCAGTCVGALADLMKGAEGAGAGAVEELETEAPERWYPVIDYSRCAECGQCFDFCLFGAYERDDGGRVKVSSPDSCKPGCPACARVCPAGAIIFPHYQADEAIAGAPGCEIPHAPPDRDALVAAVRSAAATGCDCSEAVKEALAGRGGACSACGCTSPDGIDELIDALDELDA